MDVEQDDGKKVGVEKQYSKGFEFQNEWACLQRRGIFVLSDSTASPYLKMADPTLTNQSSSKALSSYSSEIDEQKSEWGELLGGRDRVGKW